MIFVDNDAENNGGGFYAEAGAAPILHRCVFRRNRASSGGGASLFDTHAGPRVEECLFEDNAAIGMGGAVAFEGHGTPSMTGCTLRANFGDAGGAVSVSAGMARITGCRFESNGATYGGAIDLQSGEGVKLVACEFLHNRAASEGGALHGSSSVFAAEDCRIVENTTEGTGGAGYFRDSSGTLLRSSVLRNVAAQWAGGFLLLHGRFAAVEGEFIANGLALSAVEPEFDVDARANFWGDATGPFHPIANPDGLGDEVSDRVLFDPWEASSDAADDPGAPAGPAPRSGALAILPNPSKAGDPVRIVLGRACDAGGGAVFDVAGRRVRVLAASPDGILRWDCLLYTSD
ncbi:MAG: right-handed parallel beta-helix repeat-containing protein, partial [Candidatus Eisenbacteria bacterium]|nr:right-handed parallel beta-helix repeat-containing protein [Candidatus Eisenbacteria bacterium]